MVQVLRRGSILVEMGKWVVGLLAWGLTIGACLWGLRWYAYSEYDYTEAAIGEVAGRLMPLFLGLLAACIAVAGIVIIRLVLDDYDARRSGPFWHVTDRIDTTEAARTVLDVPETRIAFDGQFVPVRTVPRKHARRFTAVEVEAERSKKRAERDEEAAWKREQQEMARERQEYEQERALWRDGVLRSAAEGRSWKAKRR